MQTLRAVSRNSRPLTPIEHAILDLVEAGKLAASDAQAAIDAVTAAAAPAKPLGVTSVRVSDADLEALNALVRAGRFPSRSEAIRAALLEGLAAFARRA